MALSNEDKKDVSQVFGKKTANAVSRVTKDSSPFKYQHMDQEDLNAGRPLKYHTPTIKREMAKKKSIAKKMGVKHSDDRMLFYRTLKDKKDYDIMHMKATPITPSKIKKSS